MSLKTIKVNPIFLMGSGGGGGSSQAKNKTRKEKPVSLSLGQPNSIKKKLIARIKNFQQEKKNTTATTTNNADEAFTNDFSESVQFLDNLARDKQEHKVNKHNATLKKKQPRNEAAYMQIATELPPELMGVITPTPPLLQPPVANLVPIVGGFTTQATTPLVESSISGGLACVAGGASPPWSAPPAPSYSNLKTGGTKPTYRTWLRNTQKNKHVSPIVNKPISILEEISQPIISTPSVPSLSTPSVSTPSVPSALAQTAATLSISTEIPTVQLPTVQFPTVQAEQQTPINPGGVACVAGGVTPPYRPTLFRKRKKVTRTLKYKLGKHANGKVSVLIKNNQTRRRVQTEQAQLKLKSILDIKNHLRSKNLLKAGSEAPNDVLRHIYEQSILAGQIENKSKDTLIHNYFNEEKK